MTNCITEEELKTSQSWKLAYVSTITSKSSQASDQEFHLDKVNSKLVITKKVIIPAFQTVIVRGLTKVTGHRKCVHVLVEPSPQVQKYICSRQYFRINIRRIRGSSSTLKFIWEGCYSRATH